MTSATFSACRNYRYWLKRKITSWGGTCLFVLLNPSTADELTDDPTLKKCLSFARSWDFGQVEIVNLFALRAVNPKVLNAAEDPVGQENDRIICQCASRADIIVAGWGNCGTLHHRDTEVMKLLLPYKKKLYYLRLTNPGYPAHPLYLKNNLIPIKFYEYLTIG